MSTSLCFQLDPTFFNETASWKSPFADNVLGALVFYRTYSRNGEHWRDTVKRVVEGVYHIQKQHIEDNGLGWNEEMGQRSAQEMFRLIFNLKFTPPGRSLYCGGCDVVHKKNLAASLNNCAFVSTKNMHDSHPHPEEPFTFMADASMLGVGVGFDTKGAGKQFIHVPLQPPTQFVVPDSREGWVESMGLLLRSYFVPNTHAMTFDYSQIRKKGMPLKTFGGLASGAQPLIDLHEKIREILTSAANTYITERIITDIANLIGKCVVSGNVRRTALIAFGTTSDEFLNLKNYQLNPERADYGWTSNNSIFAEVGQDYSPLVDRITENGEPGVAWMDNMRAYSRMCDEPDYKDHKAEGANPCVEQTLESHELCCLVECFPARHDTKEEFLRTLKFAYMYAKSITLTKTHWPESNKVMLRNRRIGCSVSGVTQFIAQHDLDTLRIWLDEGYKTIQHWDEIYSNWFCIPRSIKMTSVKPSGTVSLLAGATPGVHFPESQYYIRRVRISKTSPLINMLHEANYPLEDCVGDEVMTSVVEIPIFAGENVRSVADVSIWEQVQLTMFMQKYWADNQVSSTVTFDPVTEKSQLEPVLNYAQYGLKAISFLPRIDYGAFPQMPYEAIDKAEYDRRIAQIKPCDFSKAVEPVPINSPPQHGMPTEKDDVPMPDGVMFCDGDHCMRPQK